MSFLYEAIILFDTKFYGPRSAVEEFISPLISESFKMESVSGVEHSCIESVNV